MDSHLQLAVKKAYDSQQMLPSVNTFAYLCHECYCYFVSDYFPYCLWHDKFTLKRPQDFCKPSIHFTPCFPAFCKGCKMKLHTYLILTHRDEWSVSHSFCLSSVEIPHRSLNMRLSQLIRMWWQREISCYCQKTHDSWPAYC